MSGPRIRLHVEQPLGAGQAVVLARAQAHYLASVMRLGPGGRVLLFNGVDGEWRAEITQQGRDLAVLLCEAQTAPQRAPPDLWLLFAPLRRERTAFLVEKAVELGVARLVPVITRRANAERLRLDRERAHAVEAAEQCGATWVPEVAEPQPLARVLATWPVERQLFWADELRAGRAGGWDAGHTAGPAAILIGPEGGFDPSERDTLCGLPFAHPVALGPRILRAETAALAALTLWQVRFGDWA